MKSPEKVVKRVRPSVVLEKQMREDQLDAAKEILEYFEKSKRRGTVLLRAYMSFGKTRTAIYTALKWMEKPSGVRFEESVLVQVPPNCIRSWIDEYTNIFPNLADKKIKVNERKVLFYHDLRGADKKYLDAQADAFRRGTIKAFVGRIIVAATGNLILSDSCTLIILDEPQRMVACVNDVMATPGAKLVLGASITSNIEVDYTISINKPKVSGEEPEELPIGGLAISEKPSVKLPSAIFSIVETASTSEISDQIMKDFRSSGDKPYHGIVLMKNAKDAAIIKGISGIPVFDYTSRQVTHGKMFNATGGLLVSTVKAVQEGTNFTHCTHYYIHCSGAVLKSLQQATNRVIRTTSVYPFIHITYYVVDEVTKARAILAPYEISGYESKSAAPLRTIFNYLDNVKKINFRDLTPYEKVVIFATKDADTYHISGIEDQSFKNISVEELYHIL